MGTSSPSPSYTAKASPVCCLSYSSPFSNHFSTAFPWQQQQLPTWKSNLGEVPSAFPILCNLIQQVEAAGKSYCSVTSTQKIMSRSHTLEKPTSAKEMNMLLQNHTENGKSPEDKRDGMIFESNCKASQPPVGILCCMDFCNFSP